MTKNRYGRFFYKLTGKDIDKCTGLEVIDREVEKKRNEKLHVKAYHSSAVHSRGNIFHYTPQDAWLDKKIDRYLSR